MALTPSNMLPLGTRAPDFTLPDTVSGRTLSLAEVKGTQGTVVMFICNHCPYVKHVNPELVRLAKEYQPRGTGFVAISSNDARSHPDDAPERMREAARALGYPFPYLHDESQQVARAYQAACTPDFYLFDAALQCVYRGQLDDSRPGQAASDGRDLRAALEALLAGRAPSPAQKPSVGCNIKWKARAG
ncbi:MAG TPA: thioredoxin family protein [Candidatus Binatia bacterium]|nr:thioredoxin family protein [Candidatus Binatia bacterium]